MKKSILSVILLASGLLSGCSSEESVSRPETIGQTGTLTFSFPAPRQSVTYAINDATEPETAVPATDGEIEINDLTVYMFENSDNGLLKAKKPASQAEVGARSVAFDVNDFATGNADYVFYAVANGNGNFEDSFAVGNATLNDFTTAVAINTGTSPIPGNNMLMVGYTTIPRLDRDTPPSQTIVLRHRVARFDIDNLASDGNPNNNNLDTNNEGGGNAAETFFEIKKIHVLNTLPEGYLTAEDNTESRPELDGRVSLKGGNAIDVSGIDSINTGLAKGAFYLWPGKLDRQGTMNDASTVIEVEGIYAGDGEPRLYRVQLLNDQAIEANKRYTLKVQRISQTTLEFKLEVSAWGEGEEMEATPPTGAFEYSGFSLNGVALGDSDEGFDLSDNRDDTLRFSTLSENRATGELKAGLELTLGTDYAPNVTPVAEGAPVVTYTGGKIKKTYRIVLPKTTYPVKGTITIDDVKPTDIKKTFNIASLPFYENTTHKPVLVEGRYWAPVNVGAKSTGYSANRDGCGYYFQWGRNVPFDYNTGATEPGPLSAETAAASTKFITSASDWLDVPNDDLWSDANAQGPCPAGWQVPTLDELTVLFNKHISTNFSGSRLRIPRDTGQSGDDLYLPAAGEISSSNGGGSSQDANGRYWSSTASNNNGMRFAFASAKYLQEFARANGYSVRCIQKQGRQ